MALNANVVLFYLNVPALCIMAILSTLLTLQATHILEERLMVDGKALIVDATEGPVTQTRFVLSKALGSGLR